VFGVALALLGLVFKPLHHLYDYAWFVGFFASGFLYVALMKLTAMAPEGLAASSQF